MVVSAHGAVDAYCAAHNMTIGERYSGKLEDYRGGCLVLVTDNCEDQNDYFYMKYKLLKRKIELISTHWEDRGVEEFVAYLAAREQEERRNAYGGRVSFGFKRENGQMVEDPEAMKVVRRILELRDQGCTYRKITEDPWVRYPDGRSMGISTVQVILKNRGKYAEFM